MDLLLKLKNALLLPIDLVRVLLLRVLYVELLVADCAHLPALLAIPREAACLARTRLAVAVPAELTNRHWQRFLTYQKLMCFCARKSRKHDWHA